MRIITINSKDYESKVYVIDEKKLIYKLDCDCRDFIHRRLKRIGQVADIKVFSEPCKHLKTIVKALEGQGYTLKKPKPMQGSDRCTAELRRFLIERSNGICEIYNCDKPGTDCHRKIRKSSGGKYNKSNCVLLCNEHHKKIHSQEKMWAKGR